MGGVRVTRVSTWARALKDLRRNMIADRASGLAAEIAFFAVLSLFPGLLIVAALLGSLDVLAGPAAAQRAEATVLDFLRNVLTDRAANLIRAVNDLFDRQRGSLVPWALLGNFWALSAGFATAIRALDLAYGVREKRPWWSVQVTALLLALGSVLMIAFLVAMMVVGPILGHGSVLAERLGLGAKFSFAWDWLRGPLSFALLTLWLATIYKLGPSHRAPWTRGLPGAVIAGVLALAASLGLRGYVNFAARLNQVFVVLGGGLSLLIWIYLLSLSLLAGGEVNAILAGRRGSPRR